MGITNSTYCGYETGKREPGVAKIKQLSKILGIPADDLLDTGISAQKIPLVSSGALQLSQDYDKLDAWGQKQVRCVVDNELARCAEQAQAIDATAEPDNVIYITNYFTHPMSAGTGEEAGQEEPEELLLKKRPPRGTSYVARVRGDSMEPLYHNGDRLFIRAQEMIYPGQVGVFYMDGQQWVKELGDGVLIPTTPHTRPGP